MSRRTTSLLVVLSLLAGCDQATPAPDDDDNDATSAPDVTPPAEELCNGVDDDGDGLVDEGHPDLDVDGVADCVDAACTATIEGFDALVIDPSCTWADPEGQGFWELDHLWRWAAEDLDAGVSWSSYSTPATGYLTDSNQDGIVDEHDALEVVQIAYEYEDANSGWVVVLGGATGAQRWALPGYQGVVPDVLVADVVAGEPGAEILAFYTGETEGFVGGLDLLSGDGATLWSRSVNWQSAKSLTLVAAGGGTWELLIGNRILDPATGDVLRTIGPDLTTFTNHSLATDLDGDGVAELILQRSVFRSDGQLLWSAPPPPSSNPDYYGAWWAPVEVDADAELELAFFADGLLRVFDTDGALLDSVSLGHDDPYAPCLGDLDGDGVLEVAFGSWLTYGTQTMTAARLDGTVLWELPIDDSSGAASCSTADLDGDGSAEVLFAGESEFMILDGLTGAVLTLWEDRFSGTYFEYPVVADLDGDGSSEILVGTNLDIGGTYDWQGLHAFKSAGAGWAPVAGPWYGWDYPLAGPQAGLGQPLAPGDEPQPLRAARSLPTEAVDLVLQADLDCLSGCAPQSILQVAAQVGNQGLALWEGEATLEVRAGDTTAATAPVLGPLAAGEASAVYRFPIPLADLESSTALTVRLVVEPSTRDCDVSNTVVTIPLALPCD